MKLIKTDEIANLLGISQRSVVRLLKREGLNYYRIGRRIYVDQPELEKFIKSNKNKEKKYGKRG